MFLINFLLTNTLACVKRGEIQAGEVKLPQDADAPAA